MCWKIAKVRALSNDIICDWMHVCLYSWLCAHLGMCDNCVPSLGMCGYIHDLCARLGDMCLFYDAKLVMCIHMICDKCMTCLLMCMSRGQHEVRTDATCLYWFVIIWFVRNIWFVGGCVCRGGQHEVCLSHLLVLRIDHMIYDRHMNWIVNCDYTYGDYINCCICMCVSCIS